MILCLAGLALIVGYVALNRDLLYSQNVAPYVFVLPFIITFLVFFLYPFISTVMMSFQDITGAGTKWIGFKNYQENRSGLLLKHLQGKAYDPWRNDERLLRITDKLRAVAVM